MAGAFDWEWLKQAYEPVMPTEEEALARRKGLFGGVADLGGLTTFASRNFGTGEIADEVQRLRAEDPVGAAAVDIVNPLSLGAFLAETGKNIYDGYNSEDAQMPTLQDKDAWISENRRKIPSRGEYEQQAATEMYASEAYQKAGPKNKQAMEKALAKRVADSYQTDIDRIDADNAALEGRYQQEVAAPYDTAMRNYYDQDFADRHPILSPIMAAAGPVIAGLATRGVWNKANKGIADAVKAVDDARKVKKGAGVAQEAEALARLRAAQKWGNVDKGASLGLGALVPLEMQMMGDYIDRKQSATYRDSSGQEQPVLSQQRAADKMSDPTKYILDNSLSLVGGVLGAGWGAKSVKNPSRAQSEAMRRTVDPAEYKALADAKIEAAKQDARVAKARAKAEAPAAPVKKATKRKPPAKKSAAVKTPEVVANPSLDNVLKDLAKGKKPRANVQQQAGAPPSYQDILAELRAKAAK